MFRALTRWYSALLRWLLAIAVGILIFPVSLQIFDLAGRRVRTLQRDELLSAGQHVATFARGALASGVYFVRLEAGAHQASQKLIVID